MSAEDIITALLAAIADADRALSLKAQQLKELVGWSEVTSHIEVGRWCRDGLSKEVVSELIAHGVTEGPWISGYVDGELEKVGGLDWWFQATRHERSGWKVERSLNPNATGEQKIVRELPPIMVKSSNELSRLFPGLIGDLLDVQPPSG